MTDLIDSLYNYVSLPGEDYIRIIHLQPGDESDTLACNLLVHSLSDVPEYEALSYAWGNPHKDHSIICEGNSLLITPSLHDALTHLRYRDVPRLLWADAICINQADYDEKGSQVAIMAQIYRSAKHVVIWLGPEKPNTDLAISTIDQIVTHCLEQSSTSFDELN